jgi:hypothetical protein
VSESRLRRLEDGRYQYTPKKGVTFTLTAEALVRRLVSLMPPAKVHLTSFHGVYAPHAALGPRVTMPPPPAPTSPSKETKTKARTTRRLDWAALHQHTFGVDVLRCPCGGRRRIHAIHSTRKTAFGAPASARPSTPLAIHPPTHHRPALAAPGWPTDSVKQVHRARP